MNKLIVLVLLCPLVLFGQKKSEQKKNLPPGFEWVKTRGLLVSINEITTSEWVEFMASQSGNGDPDYLPRPNSINDSCVCRRDATGELIRNDPNETIYRDTTFREMKNGKVGKKQKALERCATLPITGITLEQATEYCQYLTEQMAVEYPELAITFRLPSPQEMDALLSDTFSAWTPDMDNYKAYQNGINGHGCAIYNFSHNSWCDSNLNMKYRYGYRVPMEASLFFSDPNGLYDLMGNVAEMTSEKGVAKGGSCIDTAAACQPGAINPYTEPQFWLGFRVVADLK